MEFVQADRHARDNRAPPVPVTVISGFLGSGKTTLLNRLLQDPAMAGAAVIVNEFGDIGIDHLLVENIRGDAVLLESGCLCCAVRGDLVDTMRMMAWQADNDELPAFDRLVIETSGLADPAPVLQTIMANPLVTDRYRLAGMVTTVDAVNGAAQIDTAEEAMKQVVLASRLLITKTDIASSAQQDQCEARVRALNGGAPLARISMGEVEAATLFDERDYDPAALEDPARWLGDPQPGAAADGHADGDGQDHHAHDHPGHDHIHSTGIVSFCLTRQEPIPWPALRLWLDSLTSLRGADLLRVKGIVNVEGRDRPLVVHGVQHVFHPPRLLESWPDRDRRSRIVCITRGLAERDVSNALDAAIGNLRD